MIDDLDADNGIERLAAGKIRDVLRLEGQSIASVTALGELDLPASQIDPDRAPVPACEMTEERAGTAAHVENAIAGRRQPIRDRAEPVLMPEPLQASAARVDLVIIAGRDLVVELRPELAHFLEKRRRSRLNAP